MKKKISFVLALGSLLYSSIYVATPESTAQEIIKLLQTGESKEYFGEEVSQLFHALQAAQRARDTHCDDQTIIAALLHDIGHICSEHDTQQMGIYGAVSHEKIGAQYLKSRGFSEKTVALVQGHVDAKRYLCYKNPEYYHALSPASQQTLAFQGGPMTKSEAEEFEKSPYFKEILLVRSFDEKAKDPHATVVGVEAYLPLLIEQLSSQQY